MEKETERYLRLLATPLSSTLSVQFPIQITRGVSNKESVSIGFIKFFLTLHKVFEKPVILAEIKA